ncbi:hypothetical protein BSBH6_03792 [Bacillus subtilis]|nr:hypothetical protein BSBH6_03792 [Bacillus subtilis]RPK20607.1 hypothetical protein BH5_03824 [Bacillus subtilis]
MLKISLKSSAAFWQVEDILLKAGMFTGKALFLQMFPNSHSWYIPICQDAYKK